MTWKKMSGILAGIATGSTLALTQVAVAQNEGLVEDLRFAGGTLSEFVELLDEENGDLPLNVLYRAGAERVEVNPIRLAWVDVEAAMSAVADLSNLGLQVKPGGAGVPVFIMTRRPTGPFSPVDATDTHIVPLGAKLELTGDALIGEVDVVASAVELALESKSKPDLKLHPQTGLLIVRGSPSQVRTVLDVIEQMSQVYKRRSAEYYELERSRIAAEAQLRQIDTELNTAMEAYGLASHEYKEMEKAADNGAVSKTEVKRSRLRLIEKEGEIKKLEVQLDLARRELELLEDHTERGETRRYRRSVFFEAESSAIAAIKAMGRASHAPISVEVVDNFVSIQATEAQHKAIMAILSAMEAARAN